MCVFKEKIDYVTIKDENHMCKMLTIYTVFVKTDVAIKLNQIVIIPLALGKLWTLKI